MLKQENLLLNQSQLHTKRKPVSGAVFFAFLMALVFLVFGLGIYSGRQMYQPEVITHYQVNTIDKVLEKVVYTPVDRVVESVVYEPVEKIVEKPVVKEVVVPQQFISFKDLDELQQWLKNSSLIEVNFNVVGQNQQTIKEFDCDDYARRLQEKALQDGYIVSLQVIQASEYNSLFKETKLPAGAVHAINSVIIGNDVYFIEPQTNETVLVAYVD